MRSSDFPDERDLMPYEASSFVASRVVVFAPHPDDEVFGCGGALADLRDRGARVDVVLVTDGAAAGRFMRAAFPTGASATGSRRSKRCSPDGSSRRRRTSFSLPRRSRPIPT